MLFRSKIHATRFAQGVKKTLTEEIPASYGRLREVAPYLPALVRYVGVEARDYLPVIQEGLEKMVEGLVKPTDEEEQAIHRAEEAAAVIPKQPVRAPAASLPVMA